MPASVSSNLLGKYFLILHSKELTLPADSKLSRRLFQVLAPAQDKL